MAKWYNAKLPVADEEETRNKVKEIVKTCKTVEDINRYLIDNVEDTYYFDEGPMDTTAFSALILGQGDCYGFSNAMLLLLEEIGVTGEAVRVKDTRALSGVLVNGKFYSPYVQKLLERREKKPVSIDEWIASRGYEKPTEFVRTEIKG